MSQAHQLPITISGHHIEVTPALQAHVEKKLLVLSKRFDRITSIHVVLLSHKKNEHCAEATVHVAQAVLNASETTSDMYASIDGLAHKLERQLVKHKEKMQQHHQAPPPHHPESSFLEDESEE